MREDDRLIYKGSIATVHRAGQAVLWDGSHLIDQHLTLESAPGHTPGSSVLRLASGGDRAVFVGENPWKASQWRDGGMNPPSPCIVGTG